MVHDSKYQKHSEHRTDPYLYIVYSSETNDIPLNDGSGQLQSVNLLPGNWHEKCAMLRLSLDVVVIRYRHKT